MIVVDRDLLDSADIFRCLHADTGEPAWTLRYPARGNLDYGNSPRATPLVAGDLAYLYGAFGHLHCVELATGNIVWKKEVRREFGAEGGEFKWGMASSPLIVEGKLIINPGGPEASLVALDPRTGEVLWKTPGEPAAFASFIAANLGGKNQVVGYDSASLGGWDAATGTRLWKLIPDNPNDFNVPTPIVWDGKLVVSSENNGTRLYGFDGEGKIIPQPLAQHTDLAPDMHTPIAVGNRLFGIHQQLFCLDLKQGLAPAWAGDDQDFLDYTTLIASDNRLLVTSQSGQLLLLDAGANELKILSRLTLFPDENGVYSHPALVGNRLYVRSSGSIACLVLER